jgi:hypothetical protein
VSEAEQRAYAGWQYDRAREMQRLLELDRDRQRMQRERGLANASAAECPRVPPEFQSSW